MLTFAGIVLGILLLLGGGALLVKGASQIAASYGVSPMIVGLTIVGFGTSSPELVVNVIGALQGASSLAFGNVIGSNISNLALVLGASALISPIAIQGVLVRRELPLLLLATTAVTVMALDGPLEGRSALIGRTDSIVLILLFFIFIYISILDLVRVRQQDQLLSDISHSEIVKPTDSRRYSWMFVIAGFVLLFIGGELTIDNGVEFAAVLGIEPAIVGLFVVAVGTSMPELVTSIIAAVRGESDLALGNVIGSNIFNTLMVLPVSGFIAPIAVPEGGIVDLVTSWVLAAILIPIFFLGRAILGRVAGVLLLIGYAAYAGFRIIYG